MSVWRRRFRLFWAGDTISAVGSALSLVAVPLLAVESLNASGAEVGLVRSAQTLPFLLLALPVGWLADRMSRRRLMLIADAVRAVYLAVNSLAAQAFQTALLLLVTRSLDRSAAAFGFTVAAFGAGFLLGAAISPDAARRFGTGPFVIAAAMIGAAGIAMVAVSASFALIIAGTAISGAGPGMFNLHSIAVRQRLTPTALLGRVNALVKTISYGASTLGALAGGLAEPRIVIAAAAGVSAVAAALLAGSPVRRLAGGSRAARR